MFIHKNSRNPLMPPEYHFPDCEAHVMSDGKLYLYGSYDREEGFFCSDQYHVVSTGDMVHWTVHDVSFQAAQAEWASGSGVKSSTSFDTVKSPDDLPKHIKDSLPPEALKMPFEQLVTALKSSIEAQNEKLRQRGAILYAPDAIEHKGKYYLYMCLSDDSEGIAVSSRPEGPFETARRLPVNGIDPAVFVDDDGRAYYYWGQFSANAAALNPDMMTLDESSIVTGIVTEKTHHFHEGSSMRKRGDTYYYVFADTSRGKPTALGYATGKSPWGPFTYRGIIIDNNGCDPGTWNNHGSIEEFNGQWYVFYHRSSRNGNGMRRVCVEKIYFEDDGTIPEVKMTSQGAGAPFAPGERIPAFTACELHGGAYIGVFNGSEAIINAGDGDFAVFRYVKNDSLIRKFYCNAEGTGEIELWLDGTMYGKANIISKKQEVNVPPGTHEIKIVFRNPKDCVLIDIMLEEKE
jgi:hypothetical protein